MIAVAKTTDDGRCTRIPRRDSTTCLSLQNTEWELFSDWRCRVFLFVVVDVQSKQAVSQVSVKDVSLCFLSFSCLLRRERNWNQKGLQKSLELLHELPLEMNYLENFVLINIISELALSFLICCIFSHSLTHSWDSSSRDYLKKTTERPPSLGSVLKSSVERRSWHEMFFYECSSKCLMLTSHSLTLSSFSVFPFIYSQHSQTLTLEAPTDNQETTGIKELFDQITFLVIMIVVERVHCPEILDS